MVLKQDGKVCTKPQNLEIVFFFMCACVCVHEPIALILLLTRSNVFGGRARGLAVHKSSK